MAKFGLSQRNHPTPDKVNLIAKAINGIFGVFIGWTATNDILPAKLENIIIAIMGLLLLIIPFITPLFGVEITSKTVPTGQVTAIDTDIK